MSGELINKKIEEMIRMPAEKVKDTLPLTLDKYTSTALKKCWRKFQIC